MNNGTRWSKIGVIVLTVIGMLAMAGLLYASGGGEAHGGGHGAGGLGLTHEKLMDLLWRALNFACLVVILVLALKKPIANGLGGRRESIKAQFEELEAQKAEAEKKYKDLEVKLSRIDEEVKNIVDAAVAQGEMEKQRIIDDANRAAGDIKRQADMAVQQALADATRNLRVEVAEQAVQMAEELCKKNLQESDQNKLIEDYLEKVGGLK